MRRYNKLLILIIGLHLIFSNQCIASDAPEPPCDFYGYEVEGYKLKQGDVITVTDPEDAPRGSYTVTINGQYGFLSCETVNESDAINFYLNARKLLKTAEWTKGGSVRVDIGEFEDGEVSIELHRGFNQICFSVIPYDLAVPYNASNLIQDMSLEGLNIDTVLQWNGTSWVSYQISLSGTDFEIDLNKGIFVNAVSESYKAGIWTVQGKKTTLPKVVNIQMGWNLLAIPTTININTCHELLQDMNTQGIQVDVVMWWDGDDWVSTEMNIPFTEQELIKGNRGYFIRSNTAGVWEMR